MLDNVLKLVGQLAWTISNSLLSSRHRLQLQVKMYQVLQWMLLLYFSLQIVLANLNFCH